MTVIKLSSRHDAARAREAATFEEAEVFVLVARLRRRYSRALADQILRCIIEVVQTNSEEPIKRLPVPIRQKLLAAFREEAQRPNAVASVLPFSA